MQEPSSPGSDIERELLCFPHYSTPWPDLRHSDSDGNVSIDDTGNGKPDVLQLPLRTPMKASPKKSARVRKKRGAPNAAVKALKSPPHPLVSKKLANKALANKTFTNKKSVRFRKGPLSIPAAPGKPSLVSTRGSTHRAGSRARISLLQRKVDAHLLSHIVLDGERLSTYHGKTLLSLSDSRLDTMKVLDLVASNPLTWLNLCTLLDSNLQMPNLHIIRVISTHSIHGSPGVLPSVTRAIFTQFLRRLADPCVVNFIDARSCSPSPRPTVRGLHLDCDGPVTYNILFDPSDEQFSHTEVRIKFSQTSTNILLMTPTTGSWPVTFIRPESVNASLLFSVIRAIVAAPPNQPYRVTLVGVDLWLHKWLGSTLDRPSLLGTCSLLEPLYEPTPIDPSLEWRLWYWIEEMARASARTDDEVYELLDGVKMLTVEEFKEQVGDTEDADKLFRW